MNLNRDKEAHGGSPIPNAMLKDKTLSKQYSSEDDGQLSGKSGLHHQIPPSGSKALAQELQKVISPENNKPRSAGTKPTLPPPAQPKAPKFSTDAIGTVLSQQQLSVMSLPRVPSRSSVEGPNGVFSAKGKFGLQSRTGAPSSRELPTVPVPIPTGTSGTPSKKPPSGEENAFHLSSQQSQSDVYNSPVQEPRLYTPQPATTPAGAQESQEKEKMKEFFAQFESKLQELSQSNELAKTDSSVPDVELEKISFMLTNETIHPTASTPNFVREALQVIKGEYKHIIYPSSEQGTSLSAKALGALGESDNVVASENIQVPPYTPCISLFEPKCAAKPGQEEAKPGASADSSSDKSRAGSVEGIHIVEKLFSIDQEERKQQQRELMNNICLFRYDIFKFTSHRLSIPGGATTLSPASPSRPLFPYVPANRLLIHVKSLNWSYVGNNDQIYVTMALYDIEQRIKLTETVQFDFLEHLEDPTLKAQLHEPDLMKKFNQFLLQFSYRSPYIYILVRLKTILKGDLDEITSFYTETSPLSNKERMHLQRLTCTANEKLYPFTQNFAWGAAQVFNDKGNLLIHDSTNIKLYKVKPVLDENSFYEHMMNPEKLKVCRPLEGFLTLSGYFYTPEKYKLQHVLNVNNVPYLDYDIVEKNFNAAACSNRTVITEPIKELKEFEQPFHPPYTRAAYENNLYVYVRNINVATNKVKTKSAAIRVWLLETEGNPDTASIPAIYTPQGTFARYYITTIDYGERNSVCTDEIKINLPLVLTEKHHLLFQVLSANQKIINPKKKISNSYTLVGQCFLPLYKACCFKSDTTYVLKVLAPPLNGIFADKLYLIEPPENYVDEEKFTVTVSTHLSSLIYTVNEPLATFYFNVNKSGPDFLKALDALSKVPDRILLANFVSILNQLWKILLSDTLDESYFGHSFCSIIEVALKVYNLTADGESVNISEELVSYADYHYDPSEYSSLCYEFICEAWVYLLNISSKLDKAQASKSSISNLTTATVLDLSWWLFSLIKHSMEYKVIVQNEAGSNLSHQNRFSLKLKDDLTTIFQLFHFYRTVSPEKFVFSNRFIAAFCRDLLRIMDRGFVLSLVYVYISALDEDPSTFALRFEFLKILSTYEHYIPLNLPGVVEYNNTDLVHAPYLSRHFFSGMYTDEFKRITACEDTPEISDIRQAAIISFRNLIWSHCTDPRYADIESYKLIAGIYFPWAIQMITSGHLVRLYKKICLNVGSFSKMITHAAGSAPPADTQAASSGSEAAEDNKHVAEFRDWCVCIVWILCFCDREKHFLAWKNCESNKNLECFLVFLRICNAFFSTESTSLQNFFVFLTSELLDHFMEGSEDRLSESSNSELYEALSQVVIQTLKLQRNLPPIFAMLRVVSLYVLSLPTPLFTYEWTDMICYDLCCEIVKLCHAQKIPIMSFATTILYMMLRENYRASGSFARLKLYSTVALSKNVKVTGSNQNDVINVLNVLLKYENPEDTPDFVSQVHTLIERHIRILRNTRKAVTSSSKFSDSKLEYYYAVSSEHVDCPDLRVQWLLEMSKLNEKTDMLEEAAHCRVVIAWLISTYLYTTNPSAYPSLRHFPDELARITPIISQEAPLSLLWYQNSKILSTDFTEDGLITFMTSATNLFLKCESYELAASVLLLLSQFSMDTHRYVSVGQYATQISDSATRAHQCNRTQSRFQYNYYRVGFYGKGFGEFNGKEYIYRVSPTERLADFTNNIKKRYEIVLGADAVEILNNRPIVSQNLDQQRHYLQIVNLEIYFEASELLDKDITYLDRNSNLTRFYYETAYSPDGGRPCEEVDKMYKRKEIIISKYPIPCIFQRIEIAGKETKTLGPIETAIDVLINISYKLKQALNCTPPNTKTLQILLQGAILTQVNAGPAAIIRKFLGDAQQYPPNLVEQLKDLVRSFMRACQFGLRLNAKLIQEEPGLEALHVAMNQAFTQLRDEVSMHMDV
ncbi:dedicator of cytokinesis protein 11-like [Schistocerca gregaria]|uniref:dedicator of cytokinesis protein 11-like n=1 Tax=Schistocerca gregaria TaxID=7010 RepID=UPI00211DA7F5|nr:dedicator of cytokinesis protein 11-like [Schistocerca gregaria]XP_049848873.1 dedicator of cytokinesis protein 11-like [Schistocerca gregaria]XP_049848874.1 dedicator of cytokinesis protein 11-like [Schistocerca gregaria]